jgi:hypothetical protein
MCEQLVCLLIIFRHAYVKCEQIKVWKIISFQRRHLELVYMDQFSKMFSKNSKAKTNSLTQVCMWYVNIMMAYKLIFSLNEKEILDGLRIKYCTQIQRILISIPRHDCMHTFPLTDWCHHLYQRWNCGN